MGLKDVARRWRPAWWVSLLGIALLLPSAFYSWAGRDLSVLIIVSAIFVAAGLIWERLPKRWFDRVQQVEVSAAGSSVKLGFRELSDAATTLSQVESDLKAAQAGEEAALEWSRKRIQSIYRQISTAAAKNVLTTFRTRVMWAEEDPFTVLARDPLGAMAPAQRAGGVLIVTVAGTLATEESTGEVIGEVSGPGDFNDTVRIPLTGEGNPPNRWFNWTVPVRNAPHGQYGIRWLLRSDFGEDLELSEDTFTVPGITLYTPGAENVRI